MKHRIRGRQTLGALCLLCCFALLFAAAAPAQAYAGGAEGAADQPLRVGWFNQPGYMELDHTGRPSGYVYEYLQAIAQQTGWTYQFVTGDYATLLSALQSGELDILGLQFAQTRLPQSIQLSDQAAGEFHSTLFTRADSPLGENDYPAYQGMRVAVVNNSSDEKALLDLCKNKGITVTPVYCDHLQAVEAAVRSGRADAGVTGAFVESEAFRVLSCFALRDFYFATTEKRPELMQTLNAAMAEIRLTNPSFQQKLQEKYNRKTSEYFTLTTAEKAYFAEHPVLTVVYGKPWEPVLQAEPNQEPAGVAPRILRHLEELTGVQMVYVPLENADRGDILCGVSEGNAKSDSADWVKSDAFLTLPMMLVFQDTVSTPQTLAVDEGAAIDIATADPIVRQAERISYHGAHECLDAVLTGECEAALLNSYETANLLQNNRYAKMVSHRLEGTNTNACFGVRADAEPQLLSTLNKLIGHTSVSEMNSFIIASTLDNEAINLSVITDRMPSDVAAALMAIAAILLILLVLVILRDVRAHREHARATEIVAFLDYANRINDDVWELNVLTRKRWRYRIENNEVVRTPIQPLTQAVIDRFVHPDDAPELNERIRTTISEEFVKAQRKDRLECRLMIGDAYRWTRIVFQSMLQSERHPMCLMVYIMDVDDTVRAEELKNQQLKEALASAESASTANSSFTAYISHEIRSPLNAVLGFLNIARNSIGQPERLLDCFAKSEYAANHLLALVNDVLDMRSIASGKLKIARDRFDVHALMDTLASIYNAQARVRGIRYTVEADDLPERYLIGDDLRVKQVVVNLLSNAMKFTPRGGSVTLSESQAPDGAGRVRMRFCVRDTGIGMSEEFQQRLFSAYTQQDASIAGHFGGSGLGLTIARDLVVLMDGEISVQSAVGQGTTFTVELPFAIDTEKKDLVAAQPDSNLCFANKRLLLAEDNDMNMEVATELLKQEGSFQIDGASNGREAFDRFTQSPPGTYDAILMDIRMPVMDGYEATRAIRASSHPDAARIPIIAMTADAFAEDIRQAMEAGMNDHIAKPIDIHRVLIVLATALEKQSNAWCGVRGGETL
ncbi:MAG TPA: ATP-binding protein [Candidatus Limiplasma sp.]|nr:ATP-binding protein [Candidatus Limiplasma sp.]